MAHSPIARMRAWDRLTALLPRQPPSAAMPFVWGSDGAAGALIAAVGERQHVHAGQRVDDGVGAGGGQVMHGAGQSW